MERDSISFPFKRRQVTSQSRSHGSTGETNESIAWDRRVAGGEPHWGLSAPQGSGKIDIFENRSERAASGGHQSRSAIQARISHGFPAKGESSRQLYICHNFPAPRRFDATTGSMRPFYAARRGFSTYLRNTKRVPGDTARLAPRGFRPDWRGPRVHGWNSGTSDQTTS